MNFLIMLVLKYVFFTVMLFLIGMLMNCLFGVFQSPQWLVDKL